MDCKKIFHFIFKKNNIYNIFIIVFLYFNKFIFFYENDNLKLYIITYY